VRFSSAILLNEDLIAGPSSSRLPIGFREAFTWRCLPSTRSLHPGGTQFAHFVMVVNLASRVP
jgi:hypothetical protein